MKNLNKVFAMVLVVAMMITSVAFASNFSDVADDSTYAEAVNVGAALSLFNGYEDGTFKPEGDITRAEFAAIVVRMLGQDAQAAGAAGQTDFTDVAADHWASGYINIVSKLGIVNGKGDGIFDPEANVLYQEAIKMIVVALGYEPAIGSSGYPVGYLTKGAEIGLTAGISATNETAANRGVVAQLVLNGIDIPLMKQNGYGTWVDYLVYDGYNDTTRQTLMSENLGIVKLRVNVKESSATTSSGKYVDEYVKADILNSYKSKYTTDEFTDNNGAYVTNYQISVGDTALSSLVGSNAIVYALYDNNSSDDPYALYAAKDTTKTYELKITSDDLEENEIVKDATSGIISVGYWENESDKKTTTVTIKANPTVYKNDIKLTTPNVVNELTNFYGDVSFQRLDSATSQDYDTVFITNYTMFVVDEVNATRQRVTAKNNASAISFDPDDSQLKATLYDAAGAEMDWADLTEWTVLSVVESAGTKTVINATVIDSKIAGTVTGVSSEGDEFTIDGETYKINTSSMSADDIILGDTGTYYLDVMGNICYYDTTADVSSNYAYIVAVGSSGNSLDDRLALKLYTFDGQYGTVSAAQKIKVDGISGLDSEKFIPANVAGGVIPVTKTASESKNLLAKQQLNAPAGTEVFTTNAAGDAITGVKAFAADTVITYSVNSSGYITTIDRPAYVTSKTASNVKGNFTQFNGSIATLTYDENNEAFTGAASKLYLTDKTVIMVVEKDRALADSNRALNEDDFSLFGTANLADEQDFSGATAYNVDEDGNVGFILVSNSVTIVDSGAIMAMVSGIATAKDEAGDDIYKIKVVQDGVVKDDKEEASLVTSGSNDFGLAAYDTFIPYYDSVGAVKAAQKLASVTFDANNKANGVSFETTYLNAPTRSKEAYKYGKITEIAKNSFVFAGTAGEETIKNNIDVSVYDSGASSNYKVTTDTSDIVTFDDETNKLYVDKAECDLYAICRYYDGDLVDVVFYIIRK